MGCGKDLRRSYGAEKALRVCVLRHGRESMADKINQVAKDDNSKAGTMWKLVEEFERKVAKKRGLL